MRCKVSIRKQRALLDNVWSKARLGREARLRSQMGDAGEGLNPPCVDYAAWPAIAGDHSCSARDMLGSILETTWILRIAGIAARLKKRLAAADRRDQRDNAVRDSDIADAHSLLARPDVAMQLEDYADLALGTLK
jgi:hypothetical protein